MKNVFFELFHPVWVWLVCETLVWEFSVFEFEFRGSFQHLGVGFECGLCVSFHVCVVSLCVGCV